ncbi:MAG: hypothetical protein PW734_11305 [Verrucomicrobium sp.]|nr:hypothetical protein [Verrucomicrobium sp.]
MMPIAWAGSWITFQVTFTEFFIAATVFASVAQQQGWRSAALGACLGAGGIVLLGAVLGASLSRIPFHALDWVSALLLLGFGAYLAWEFLTGLRKPGSDAPQTEADCLRRRLHPSGVGVAAWAVFAEGVEVLVVWLAVALKQGYVTATMGVGGGLGCVLLLALFLGRTGVFRKVPAVVLDGLAALCVTAYGIYFLTEAIRG